MLKVLLPTDFSSTSHNAIVYALNMFDGFDIDIELLHVIFYDGEDEEIIKNFKKTALKQFETLKSDLQKQKIRIPKEFNFHITHGVEVSKIIDDYASSHKIEMLIIGATGEIYSTSHLLSERTIELISLTTIPVLSIPKNTKYNKITDIIYATDLSDIDFEAGELIAFAKLFDAAVHFVHVFPEMLGTTKFNPVHISNDLIKKFKYPNITFDAIMDNDVEKSLIEFIDKKKPSIVAMFTHKRKIIEQLFYNSVSKEVSYNIDAPIFTFKKNTVK